MNKMKAKPVLGLTLLLLAVIFLSACATSGSPAVTASASTATGAAAASTFSDPWAYCAAVGTVDAPDARYVGAVAPVEMGEALKKAMGLADSAPLEPLVRLTVWRCMDGKVYACNRGANIPCEEKANTDKAPTADMQEFCKANPASDFIPAVVTGRETVYEWRCNNGVAEVVKQVTQADARGFLSSFWYPLAK